MAKIGFSYISRPWINPSTNEVEELYTPFIPIRLSKDRGNPVGPIDSLLDSGSDRNLFPIELARILGINFKGTKAREVLGIGGIKVKAYTAKINVWVEGLKFETEADFSSQIQTILLGRQGFFSLFKNIIFDEKGQFVYLETF